ncbi:hypothetical protein [Coleofasciculus sp. G2-EDA-02]
MPTSIPVSGIRFRDKGGCKWFIYRWGGRVQVVHLSVGRAGASGSFIGE